MFTKFSDGKTFLVCGYVPKDAEFKTVGDKQSSLCKFSVKCDEKIEEDGSKTASWTNCECWHAVAKVAANICKGDTVLALGEIKTEKYTDKNSGEEKTSKALVCSFVSIMCGDAPKQSQTPQKPLKSNAKISSSVRVEMDAAEEDYPF